MGTSLGVSPFNTIVSTVPSNVPMVLINRENTASQGFDFTRGDNRLLIQGNCDDVIAKIISDVGWEKDLKEIKN